jgi:TonB-dependent receptor
VSKGLAREKSRLVDCAAGRAGLRAGVSALAMGLLLAGYAAHAQDQTQTTETEATGQTPETGTSDTSADAEDVIVVTGIRQMLANAQNIKRDSDTVVDAITAEDIGALPDRSVTEALQRVPGIAINRFAGSNDPDRFSVEGSGVAIRGLTFVRSEFNGRTAFAAGVGGQALNFADVPSELLGSVLISKNATAEMIEGGLAGTVNLNTRKPFDRRGFHISFGAEANYGDMREEWTPTFSGLISNTWEGDWGRFGILVSGAYSRIKSRSDGLQIANYQTRDGRAVSAANTGGGTLICRNPLPSGANTLTLPPPGAACGNFGTAGADGFADYASYRVAPVGGQFRTQEFDRQRVGFSASAQFESADEKTLVTAEFIRSSTTNDSGEYTYETAPDLSEYTTYPIGCRQNQDGPPTSAGGATARAQCPVGGFTDYVYDANNLFQSGYIVNASNGWRGATNNYNPGVGGGSPYVPIGGSQTSLARRQVADETTNQDWGLNLRTDLTERMTLNLDAQYATSRKQNLDVSVFGSSFIDQQLDISGSLPVVIPRKPQFLGYTWSQPSPALGGASEAQYFTDPRFQFWRAAMDHAEDSTGTQYAFRGDLEYKFDEDAFIRRVKVGARYQDREQIVRYTTYNWGMLSETWSGSRPVNFADTPAAASARYEFPNFFRGAVPGPPGAFYYSGDLTGQYDQSVAFFRSVQDQARAFGSNPTWNPLAGRPNAIAGTPYIPSDIQPVTQKDGAAYAMLSFGSDTMFGDSVRMSGNVGVRYVTTNVQSDGQLNIPGQVALGIAQPFAVRCMATVPPNSPPGTPPQVPGGLCTIGPAAYARLQTFAGVNGLQNQFNSAQMQYDYWLPSANLKFGLGRDIILRLAASKVLTRPDNAYLRNFLNIGIDSSSGNLTGQTGNPFLLPATAWQFDASLEWYFASVGSLTLNGFYKSIENFFYQQVTNRTISNNGIDQPISVRGPANFDGTGKIKGFEVAYQQTYDFLPGLLSGLGVQANYTYIASSGLPNSFLNGGGLANNSTITPGNLPLEQLSKHNVNATVFYERGPLSMRAAYSWRSRFLLTAADVIFPYYSIFNEPTGQLDASIFVNIGNLLGLPGDVRVGVQGVNLLNEVTRTTQAFTGDPDLLAPRSYFMNDRRFSFVLRGNF